jgi:hypothetical protein
MPRAQRGRPRRNGERDLGRQDSGHGRAVAPRQFQALMTVIVQMSSASSASLKCSFAVSKTSSLAGPSVSRVAASVRVSAARSRAVSTGPGRGSEARVRNSADHGNLWRVQAIL